MPAKTDVSPAIMSAEAISSGGTKDSVVRSPWGASSLKKRRTCERIHSHSLDEQVLFLKNIPQDLKNSLVAKSNIFVMPSIVYKKSVEGFGIAFLEAAQYGISSIGGKDGGASDAIEDGKSGKICDGNNLDEIYSSINQLLTNNSYLEFGKYAKSFVKKFEWEKIIKYYKKIL